MINNKITTNLNISVIHRRLPHYRIPFYLSFINQFPHYKLRVYAGNNEKKGGSGIIIDTTQFDFITPMKDISIKGFIFQWKALNRNVLLKSHVVIFEGNTRIISHYIIMIFRKLCGGKNMVWLKGWPFSSKGKLFKRFFLSLADHYFVYGEKTIESLKNFKITDDIITIAYNTVDLDPIYSFNKNESYLSIKNPIVKRIINSNTPFIFTIGSLIEKKRIIDIIEAFVILKKTFTEPLNLVIAGNGPLRKSLEKKINDSNLGNEVYILGQIDESEAFSLFNQCKFVVFSGAVGLALNESMAWQKATIIADENGPDSEMLIHNLNGIRYPKGDIIKLVKEMQKLLKNEKFKIKLEINAYNYIKEKYSIHNMAQSFNSALNKVCPT